MCRSAGTPSTGQSRLRADRPDERGREATPSRSRARRGAPRRLIASAPTPEFSVEVFVFRFLRGGLLRNWANQSLPAWRETPYVRAVDFDVFGECLELLLKRGDPFEFDVLLVPHLNQEGFHPRKTPRDWLHDVDHDGRNSSTTVSFLCRHPALYSADGRTPVFCSAHSADVSIHPGTHIFESGLPTPGVT